MFSNNILVLLWKVLFLIIVILFLFYFVIPMMLCMGMLLRFYVGIELYSVFWQVEQSILLFNLINM